ncbi:hypothetical protein ACTA71_008584 [Dictyostelium dimigraforme]
MTDNNNSNNTNCNINTKPYQVGKVKNEKHQIMGEELINYNEINNNNNKNNNNNNNNYNNNNNNTPSLPLTPNILEDIFAHIKKYGIYIKTNPFRFKSTHNIMDIHHKIWIKIAFIINEYVDLEK